MKKVLCFAAAAMAIFASCQKTEVVYNNDGPQEIGIFAVNKVATKAPVSGTLYPEDYDMQVAAYVSAGATTSGDYFDGALFKKNDQGTWTGGKYWPLTSSTLNFLAVTQPATANDYTCKVTSVEFGNDSKDFTGKAVVNFDNNETTAEKFNQFDLMFAAGKESNSITEGGVGTYTNVGLAFTHALSWINFTVAKNNVTAKITVNSIRLSGASYGGTLTLTNAKYNNATTSATSDVTPVWNPIDTKVDNVYVPGGSADEGRTFAGKNTSAAAAAPVVVGTTSAAFGNGLLVVPGDYVKDALSFTINYTIDQDGKDNTTSDVNTFEYTYKLPVTKWVYAKKYTYAITMKLNEIEVAPSVEAWSDGSAAGTVEIGKEQ